MAHPSARRALLVVAAWWEEGSASPLRVEIRRTTDVTLGFDQAERTSDVDAACEAIRSWLVEMRAISDDGREAEGPR